MATKLVAIMRISVVLLFAAVLWQGPRRLCYRWLSSHSPDERLLDAIEVQDRDAVAAALADGASPNAAHPFADRTALMIASSVGDVDLVRELIARGASVDARDRRGAEALAHAAYRGHAEVVQELIRSGAMVDQRDSFGLTPLAQAAMMGKYAPVEVLLRHGAAVDAADEGGWTPLMNAISAPQTTPALIALLLRSGADPLRKDNTGRCAWDYAVDLPREPITSVLEEHLGV